MQHLTDVFTVNVANFNLIHFSGLLPYDALNRANDINRH